MIYKQCVLTIAKNTATLDEDIYLYRLDKNVEIYFTIVNNKYKFDKSDLNNIITTSKASYFQLRLYKNAEVKYTFAIQPTDNGQAILTITDDLIDEPIEVGDYDFQISLLDKDKSSMISMPIVSKQIHVCEPLVTDASETGTAVLGLSTLETTGEIVDAFDENGNYIRKVHVNGELISAELFNKWETAFETNSKNISTLKENQINLIEDDTSMEGIDDTEHDTLTTTNKKIIPAINEVNDKFKDIANYSLTKGTDGKVYIKKQDGTLIGEGIEVGSNADLSKMSMSVSGQTLKLLNDGKQVASVDLPVGNVEIPDNTVLYEEDSESTGDVITAENITIKDTNNNFTSINVEGALSELFQSASNGKKLIATAITGKGVETSNTDSFQTMATNINNIKVGGGGITPTGTKEITQNGTYDVTNFATALVNVASTGGSTESGGNIESGTITPEEKSTDITIPTSKKCSNMMLFQHVLGTGTGYRTVVGLIRLDDFRTNLTSNSTGATLNVIATSESQINAATVTFRDNGIDVHLNSTAVGGGYLVSKPHVWYAW